MGETKEAKLQEQINQLIINCEDWELNYHRARMQAIELRRTNATLEKRIKGLIGKPKNDKKLSKGVEKQECSSL